MNTRKNSTPGAGRLLQLARPEVGILSAATVALLLAGGLQLLAPQGIRRLMDAVADPVSGRAALDQTVLWLVAIFAITAVFVYLRAFLFTVAGERVVARLRKDLFGAIIRQEVGFFDAERTGELTNRLSADTGVLQNSVTVNVSMAFRALVQGIGSLVVLFITSARLTGIMLSIVPVVAISAVVFARTIRKLAKRTQDALAQATAVAEETIGSVRTVKSFAREVEERARYGGAIDEAYGLGRRVATAYGAFQGFTSFFGYVAVAIVLWYGGRLVLDGEMTVGDLTAYVLYTLSLGVALGTLSGLYGDYNRAIGASHRVFELLDRLPGVLTTTGRTPAGGAGRMALEGVTFAYPTRPDAPVLSGVDVALEPGKVLALVGPSGSGKSTVAQLLMRFYDPSEGRVTLDGVDVRELDTHWLREQIGTVAQEPVLFATSIAENIRYGRPTASQAEVEAAARAANAHGFIAQFPDGYATLVGERGVRLSGGQKQRIAIARAILKDPRVLVLDEATSALDAESEHLVQEALERLMAGRTVLVIAHRLSTVKRADRVVVIDRGHVAEQGTHDELVAFDGVYKRLVERQFAS